MTAADSFLTVPEGLPEPVADGAADHLPGLEIPEIWLPATSGPAIDLARRGDDRTVLYAYPMTGRPGVALPDGWDAIPGARGCTPESCDFRDHFADLQALGVGAVYGMSSQTTDYQREVVERLRLPFPLLSDPSFTLASALGLPTFVAPDVGRLYKRLTLIIRAGTIEHAFYPVFPPETHASTVAEWIRSH